MKQEILKILRYSLLASIVVLFMATLFGNANETKNIKSVIIPKPTESFSPTVSEFPTQSPTLIPTPYLTLEPTSYPPPEDYSCRYAGDRLQCDNGTTIRANGSQLRSDDGTTYHVSGNMMQGNDGSNCRASGNRINCSY